MADLTPAALLTMRDVVFAPGNRPEVVHLHADVLRSFGLDPADFPAVPDAPGWHVVAV